MAAGGPRGLQGQGKQAERVAGGAGWRRRGGAGGGVAAALAGCPSRCTRAPAELQRLPRRDGRSTAGGSLEARSGLSRSTLKRRSRDCSECTCGCKRRSDSSSAAQEGWHGRPLQSTLATSEPHFPRALLAALIPTIARCEDDAPQHHLRVLARDSAALATAAVMAGSGAQALDGEAAVPVSGGSSQSAAAARSDPLLQRRRRRHWRQRVSAPPHSSSSADLQALAAAHPSRQLFSRVLTESQFGTHVAEVRQRRGGHAAPAVLHPAAARRHNPPAD